MAKTEIPLPAMGEGIIEATITRWMVKPGDTIREDDPIVEVATDKVDSEIPSPVDGVVRELLFREGEVPQVGQVLVVVETEALEKEEFPDEVRKEVERIRATEIPEPGPSVPETGEPVAGEPVQGVEGRFLSPLVRNIARQEGIAGGELESIAGTGRDGRLTKDDLLAYIAGRKSPVKGKEPVSSGAAPAKKPGAAPAVKPSQGDEIIEMDRMRRLIAEHMVHSKHTSPHVTSFIDADVTAMVQWRNRIKDSFFRRENQKITYMPLFIEAAAKALRDYPLVNASVDGTRIIVRKRVNIGMATALPNGNLIVPVIRDAAEKNLVGLAKSVNDLAHRARQNKLLPDEIMGGTFTITNFGTFRNTTGTPIINQPEVAILGVGAIRKKPAVIETPIGDAIAIRHVMVLSLSYDHRIVDGALGGMFLRKVAEYLENFDSNRSV